MPLKESRPDDDLTSEEPAIEEDEVCRENHVSDLDDCTKVVLSVFSTIRSRLQDVERAASDIKRFELSIEADRKRLQKTLETAKVALRNARVQMAVELAKADGAGFQGIVDSVKESAGV